MKKLAGWGVVLREIPKRAPQLHSRAEETAVLKEGKGGTMLCGTDESK